MPKKQKIIFITVFAIVGLIVLGVYLWSNRNKTTNDKGVTPWYQSFNPFGGSGGSTNTANTTDVTGETSSGNGEISPSSRFFKITDFAVSGFLYQDYSKPISGSDQPKEVLTTIDSNTKEGRVKIQGILNKALSLEKPLVEDGNFGKMTIEAIKKFQQENNIPTTGKIDAVTAKYFVESKTTKEEIQHEIIPSVKYVERKNGHIYQTTLPDMTTQKISNSTIPSIYEAFLNKTGNTVIYRYLSEDSIISTFLATMGKSNGQYLPANITDVSVSKDKEKFFYLVKSNNSVQGVVRNFETGVYQNIFNHQLTEWISSWDINDNIYLTTKASYFATGAMYKLNENNKTISKVLDGVKGLTTQISPDGKNVLYSTNSVNGPKLMIYSVKDNKSIDLDIYGLPEKCTWSQDNITIYCAVPNLIKGNQYPDVWYQGIVSFDDYFIMINTKGPEVFTIINSKEETPTDGISLTLDVNEKYLFFINKKDYTLWGLNIQ